MGFFLFLFFLRPIYYHIHWIIWSKSCQNAGAYCTRSGISYLFYAIFTQVFPINSAVVIYLLFFYFYLGHIPLGWGWRKFFLFYQTNYHKFLFWQFFADCILLGYLGAMPAEEPYVSLALIASIFYFLYFFLVTRLYYVFPR